MIKPISSLDFTKKRLEEMSKDFSNHVIIDKSSNSWLVANEKSVYLWFNVNVVKRSHLVLIGDFDPCIFAYYSSEPKSNPQKLVYWIADASMGYATEKAATGMGMDPYSYLPSVAIHNLREDLIDAKEAFENQDKLSKYESIINDSIADLENGTHIKEVQETLYYELIEMDPDVGEWIFEIGQVPSDRVLLAIAGIRRLASLLREDQ